MSGRHNWRLALRIARRDALRAKGRSALVVAMIALPILGATAADLAFRSGQLSAEEQLDREIGAADAHFVWSNDGGPVVQGADHFEWTATELPDDGEWEEPTWRSEEELRSLLEPLLPDGATMVYENSNWMRAGTEHGVAEGQVQEIDAADPAVAGIHDLKEGRFAESPDEIAASEAFLKDGGLAVGDTVSLGPWGSRLEDGTEFTITGSYELPGNINRGHLTALPGSVLPQDPWDRPGLLVSVPGEGGVDWSTVLAANELGFVVNSREVVLNPPPAGELAPEIAAMREQPGVDGNAVAVAVVAVSLVILEICLLAGPAFAVSARRSRRMLGLIGANGGHRPQLRAVMLASGVVLGAGAAVIGLIGGVLLTLLMRPTIEGQLGSRFGSWDFRPLELGGIAVFAVLIGLLAAVIPAYNAARSSVLSSLTGRRGVRGGGRLLPLVGGSALVLGAALAVLGGLWGETVAVAAGAVIAELGLVALTPMLVGGFGRLARFLPLAGRLALRDAARNRGRTAPAVAAVLAAVAGTVAVATVVVSNDAQERALYEETLPMDTAAVLALMPDAGRDLGGARAAVTKELPVESEIDLARALPAPGECLPTGEDSEYGGEEVYCGEVIPLLPGERDCPLYTPEQAELTIAERRDLNSRPVCGATWWLDVQTIVVIGPAQTLAELDIDDDAATRALESGEAVVVHPDYLDDDGQVTLGLYETPVGPEVEWNESGQRTDPPVETVTLPGHSLAGDVSAPTVLMTPQTAASLGLTEFDLGTFYQLSRTPTSAEQQAFDAEFERLGSFLGFHLEKGYDEDNSLALLILALVAMVITLGAAGIATGLAQADAEPDLATLSAVGATPRMRRTLSGLQCGLIAAMGVLLGTLSGLIPAIGIRLTEHRNDVDSWQRLWDMGELVGARPELLIELPWMTFLQLLVVVPLLAWLLAALLTRSRVPLARRTG
ncbi:ABC transporter permease [Streptomyces profundus]|uniref:ABC transporter permease n=1 Tax=Streptomyces profundus TaxID=2867410 RepID=UPI001D169BCB|nr:ABC transporter permease [Streptomyces sp. MA3_2.13]UED85427.1 FtsX-like permease family protein [Streptomyces sp. MA3_2.13]